ncbi:MAG: outer membrane lipoprotein carrier protein LolA [Bryobacteraceae bacterium]
MRLILAISTFLAATGFAAADTDVMTLLKSVEKRYNSAKTLRVDFAETYSLPGRGRSSESGQLSLRKPGKMLWTYAKPAGKVFVSDGKFVYYYSPDSNRAEKMKLKETEDMRAPLAFLLGKLEFDRDFKEYRSKPEGADTFITAIPKSDKLPYSEVSFVVTPNGVIRRLIVTGQDKSILDFTFANESMNPSLSESLFTFVAPKGAEFVDSTAQ